MKKYALKDFDVFCGDDELIRLYDKKELRKTMELKSLDRFFSGRDEFRQYISFYGRLIGLERYAVLDSHGDIDKANRWVYYDGDKMHPIQTWINAVDGKYSALLFNTCNPGKKQPSSKTSILMIPDSDINEFERQPIFSLIVPDIGELDLYTISDGIKKLEDKLTAR